jgi:transposase
VEERIKGILSYLNEKQRRLYLGNEAKCYGRGGVQKVHEITKVSKSTIIRGKKEIERADPKESRIRKVGGGRKKATEKNPRLAEEIESIVTDTTYGNPENPLRYTTKSTTKIAKILEEEKEIKVSHDVVGNILEELEYSLQLNQKMLQVDEPHPDREEQFKFINTKAAGFLEAGEPVISIDAKKKENIGNFKNNGSSYSKKGEPTKVLDHDFPLKELGKVTPYGVYDISKNEGFVNLGISKDTAEFAVESICRWWLTVGANTYPQAAKIHINCDGGGSNASSNRMFKLQLQEFSNQSGLDVHVTHFPPGTSKWNKIEHRLFCYISSHWRGQPLIDVKTVIDLIGSTTTTTGLKVKCIKDDNKYEIGKKVSDDDFSKINIKRDDKFPAWNYVISPSNITTYLS